MKNTAKLRPASVQDLWDMTLLSANAKNKEIFIFEKVDLSELIGFEKAEQVRTIFLNNQIKIKQITNIKTLEGFSKNDEFINKCMNFRYVPKSIYDINQEIIIFDDNVYIYSLKPNIQILHIQDQNYAESQKKLFLKLWDNSSIPNLEFKYKPEPSFYRSFDLMVKNKQMIIYPDIESKIAWKEYSKKTLQLELDKLIDNNPFLLRNASYFVIFLWSNERNKMMDIWKFSNNSYDDRSGPLSDVFVFDNFERCDVKGIASGNTLMVLGYEERKRRQSNSLEDYLSGTEPELPFGLVAGEEF